jgi:hypothetical protein
MAFVPNPSRAHYTCVECKDKEFEPVCAGQLRFAPDSYVLRHGPVTSAIVAHCKECNMTGSQSADETPILYFDIQSGVTQYPRRPVTRGRFLLGSGDACHMRLGGDDIPPIHSMIVADDDQVLLERLSTGPALRVNGEDVESVTLNDGDEISIGRILFTVRFEATAVTQIATGPVDLVADVALTPEELQELKDIESMSVVELVNQLEADTDLVNEFETAQQTGLESLVFEAANAVAADTAAADNGVDETSEISAPATLEDLIEHLNSVTRELDQRTSRLQEREQAYSVAAQDLLDQQARLREQVEALSKQISAQQQLANRNASRRSA